MTMQDTETEIEQNLKSSEQQPQKKWMQGRMPLIIAAVVLAVGSIAVGYTVGHRQGLTVVGYAADAEQLVDVVQQQKDQLDALNKNLNIAVQERDVAVSNSNRLYEELSTSKSEKVQADGMSTIYREVLRQRGGLTLTIQNLAVKTLPENAYEYQIDLMQISSNNSKVSGSVELRLIRGTDVLVVPMESKSFSFQDYQRLTGRWTMPDGYTPQYIEVRLNGATSVVKRFSWQRGKAVENLASLVADVPQAQENVQ